MRLKIIICFLVFNFICIEFIFSNAKDSIKSISLSNRLVWNYENNKNELHVLEHSFFDVDADKIILSFELNRSNTHDTLPFIFLEIKKKSLQQYRLRPIVSKKIQLTQSSFYIDSLDLPDSLFASGNFDLIINYMNDSFKVIDVKKASFQLMRNKVGMVKDEFYEVEKDKVANNISIEKTFVDKYEIVQLKKNIQSLSPLAKGIEGKVIKELALVDDLQVLKQFFYNFWVNRNPKDPEKAWSDYLIILNDLAKKYGNANTLGYDTDRGRVYIQYGAPDRLIRVINEKGALPYEVWFYYQTGMKHNVKFLFFQAGMLGNDMIMLHSNVNGEVMNPYWKVMLLQNPETADKLTHKVFEFFN